MLQPGKDVWTLQASPSVTCTFSAISSVLGDGEATLKVRGLTSDS